MISEKRQGENVLLETQNMIIGMENSTRRDYINHNSYGVGQEDLG